MKRHYRIHDRSIRASLQHAVAHARYEIIPFDSTATAVLRHVPKDVRLTVTASPARGQDATIDLAETLSRHGYDVAPHLSARLVRDREHLLDIVRRCRGAGITSTFVIGGDPSGIPSDYPDAFALLSQLHELEHPFTEIGIGGHPEGQAPVPDAVLLDALTRKSTLAHYITTQMCFDPPAIIDWAARLSRLGIEIPIHIGVPGAVRRKKLIRISSRLGIGQSARFLRHQHNLLLRFFRPGGYSPDHVLSGIARLLNADASHIGGIHIFTFNDLEATEAWRQRTLKELERAS